MVGGPARGRSAHLNRTADDVRTPSIDTAVEISESAPRVREGELVARLASGDCDDCVGALYDVYATQIYGLGLHLLRDAGHAEDLVQETFVRLWRSAHRYDPERGSVRTFVFTLARRAAVDMWRRRGAPVPRMLSEPEAEGGAGTDAYEHLLRRLRLGEALAMLTPQHREVLELHYAADLTQAQIAERLRLPLGTVKSRTLYALRALARYVEEEDVLA